MKPYHFSGVVSRMAHTPFCWMLLFIMLGIPVSIAQSEDEDPPCFSDDYGRPVCIGGGFLPFWEHHGGVATFGEPLATPETWSTPDGQRMIQYFEKARLELHPDNPPPYGVLLGRIGAEQLAVVGHGSETTGYEPGDQGCWYFAASDGTVCGRLFQYWDAHGLQLDGDPAVSNAESLALLGLPLSGVHVEAGASGVMQYTQWFERAKLVEVDGVVSAAPIGREFVPPVAPPTTIASTPTPSAAAPGSPTVPPAPTAPPAPTPDSIATPTISPIRHVSYPAVPCNKNVPVPANGLQAWVIQGGDQMVVCLRLIVDGEAVAGANAIVHRHYDEKTLPTIAHTTGLYNGVASFIFYTGNPLGHPNQLEGIASYRGVTYRTIVSP